jgi:hypothetical protein
MNVKALTTATAIGLALQLAMVIAGHYEPYVKNNVFAIGGMLISLIAGAIYAWRAGGGWGSSLLGGLIAGGLCALLGIAVSVLLKDVPASILMFGTIGSAVTGLIGGAIGKALRRA